MSQNKNLVVIFGSGATYDSNYVHKETHISPPCDSNFFESPQMKERIEKEYPAINFFLGKCKPKMDSKYFHSLEQVWSFADTGFKWRNNELMFMPQTFEMLEKFIVEKSGYAKFSVFADELQELNQAYLEEVYDKGVRREDIKIPDFRRHLFTGELGRELLHLISRIYSSDSYVLSSGSGDSYELLFKKIREKLLGVLNFNYDLFAENAWRGLNPNGSAEEIAYAHGSLGWCHSLKVESGGVRALDLEVSSKNIEADFSLHEDIIRQPGIVPPVVFKKIPEIKSVFDFFDVGDDHLNKKLKSEYLKISNWLNGASKILIIGYSLPNIDYQAIQFLGRLLSRDNIKIDILICIKGGEDEKEGCSRRYQSLLSLSTPPKVDGTGFAEFVKSSTLEQFINN